MWAEDRLEKKMRAEEIEELVKSLPEIAENACIDQENLNYKAFMLLILGFCLNKLEIPIEARNKYHLNPIEIDMLESQPDKSFSFWNVPFLVEMKRKGYFKEVPTDAIIKDVIRESKYE